MDVLQSRFKAVYDELGLSPAAFASTYNISQATVYSLVNGSRKPSLETLSDLCAIEPRINANYLLRGVGSPLIDEKAVGVKETSSNNKKAEAGPVELVDKWQQLQRAINRTIETELLAIGSAGLMNDNSGHSKMDLQQSKIELVNLDTVTIVQNDGLEMTMLKRMINTLAQLQREYSIAFEEQADPRQYKFTPEWIPNPNKDLLGKLIMAYLLLESICDPETLIEAHRQYCMELIYYRGRRFIPTGNEFDSWQSTFQSKNIFFLESRIGFAHKSIDYFLAKINNYVIARHYVELVRK